MKTTLEVPDAVYRQVKARAALKGQTVKAFVLDAIQDKLRTERNQRGQAKGWQSVFGKAPKDDVAQLQEILDEEFSGIDAGDWE